MRIYRYIQTGLLATLLIGWGCLAIGCADGADEEGVNSEIPTPPQPLPSEGEEPLLVRSLTRTGDEATTAPLSIMMYLTSQKEGGSGYETTSGIVTYEGSGSVANQTSTVAVKSGTTYNIFGYMPAGIATSSELTNISASGATLSINNMSVTASQDVCVIIGVKKGKLTVNETVTVGNFEYTAEKEDGYFGVSLLADHIYAAASLKFLMVTASNDARYSELRKIKLKKVSLKSPNKKVNVAVSFRAGNTNPISSCQFTDADTSEGTTVTELYSNADGYELKTTGSDDDFPDMTFYFAPGYHSGLTIESEYDVYDTNGKLIRSNCKAENNIGNAVGNVVRGKKKELTLKVDPTYLYMLSDEDANPGQAPTNNQ